MTPSQKRQILILKHYGRAAPEKKGVHFGSMRVLEKQGYVIFNIATRSWSLTRQGRLYAKRFWPEELEGM